MLEIPIWLIFVALGISFMVGFFTCDFLGKLIDKAVQKTMHDLQNNP